MLKKIFPLLLCSYLLSACVQEQNQFWDSVKAQASRGDGAVSISEVTRFDWDTVCVIEPYSLEIGDRDERIKRYIQGDLGKFKDKIPVLDDDGMWAFAFIRDGVVTQIEQRGRGYAIYKGFRNNCMSRNDAVFLVDGKRLRITNLSEQKKKEVAR